MAITLAACTPEPAPTPPPTSPPTSSTTTTTAPPSHPECGSAGAADGTALTVEAADGRRKVVEVPAGGDVDATKQTLRARGNRVVETEAEVPVAAAQTDSQVDDPYFDAGSAPGSKYGLWGLKAINAPEAWGTGTLAQGQGVKVAVIDTGVQGDHPGLAGRVVAGKDFIVGLPFDGRADGDGHGTHVAGTIAEIDDTAGGIGVAPQVTIVPVRVLDCNGNGTSTGVANGIYYAVDDAQVDVINLSLGAGEPSDTLRLAVEHALASGVTVVAAAGNDGVDSCPPNTPVTTTTPTSAPTSSTSGPTPTSSTTSPPVSTPGVDASPPPTVPGPTTTTATAPSSAESTGHGDEGASSLQAVTIAACTTVPTYSAPLYPAAYAIGRPGLIAVAATGSTIGLVPPSGISGTITWHVAVGDYVEAGDLIATIGATNVSMGEAGVLVTKNVASGTVALNQQFATILDAYRRASYSSVGDYVTVAAPGGSVAASNLGIFSTLPGSTYGYSAGTSMATPHVVAVAALVIGKCGTNTPAADVAATIASTTIDIGQAGWDPAFGAGLVRADAAVAATC